MISFDVYKGLSQQSQAEVLWEHGIYLELIRRKGKYCIELYSLHDFYVEIWFDATDEGPLFLKAFKSTRRLEPYLGLIDIDSIFETK